MDRIEHLEKARHNEEFAYHFDLNDTPYLDWVVVAKNMPVVWKNKT